jgi:hypothetical protein
VARTAAATSSATPAARSRTSTRPRCSRRDLAVGHGADVSVAQPVVDEGEQLAGRGDLGDVAAAAGSVSCPRSDTFRSRWPNDNVRLKQTGSKDYHHPVVGRLTLEFKVMELSADTWLALTAFTAADSASQDGPTVLASWAATLTREGQASSQQNASITT